MTKKLFGAVTIALVTACGGTATTSTASTPAVAPSGAPAPAAAARANNTLPSSVTPAMIAIGDSIFHARGCRNCHGQDAKGTGRGPDLTDVTLLHVNGSFDDYVRIITDGIPVTAMKDSSHTNAMPARGGARPAILTDDQIKSVAAYVFTLRK
jgi:mono/diheme cytochrome c family protein